MKAIFLCLLICMMAAMVLGFPEGTCAHHPEKCKENQCCVEFGITAFCRDLKQEGADCELKPLMDRRYDHVYKLKCPCQSGLKCQEHIGTLLGKCAKE